MKKFYHHLKQHLDTIGTRISEKNLIVFDYRTLFFVAVAAIAFLLLVTFKIHGSSIPLWNDYVHEKGKKDLGLLLGEPRAIRGDEWKVLTPFILSQLNHVPAMPVENDSLGAGKTPLIMSLPVEHYSAFFRPQNWGFFLLDQEHAFSFYWNFRSFGIILSFFFLLMVLTRGNFWLSFFGALWLHFSSFVQWWFSTSLIDAVISFNVIFVSLMYLLFSRKKIAIIFGAAALTIFGINFALLFYPPFQVPLAYLLVVLSAGFGIKNFDIKIVRQYAILRSTMIIAVMGVAASVLFGFYVDVKSTIMLIRDTVYPGRRISLGGGINIERYFSGFFDLFLAEKKVPAVWGNICEASNFILLYPLVILGIIRSVFQKKHIDPLVWLLIGYILALTYWMFAGVPAFIANMSLLSFMSPQRSFIGLGLGSIILVIYYLANQQEDSFLQNSKKDYWMPVMVATISFFYGLVLRKGTVNYFAFWQIVLVAVILGMLAYLFFKGKKVLLVAVVAGLVTASNFMVNPVSVGLGPIYGKKVVPFIMDIQKNDPDAKWIFFESSINANFLKAVGVDVFNGIKYLPSKHDFEVIDPQGQFADIYNRYALIIFKQSDKRNVVEFKPFSQDTYFIEADPCAEKLEQIGVKYFVFNRKPLEGSVTCLELLNKDSINKFWIFRRK